MATTKSPAKILSQILKHTNFKTGGDKEGFRKLTRQFETAVTAEAKIGTIIMAGDRSVTVAQLEKDGGMRCVAGMVYGEELEKWSKAFGGHFLLYNFFLPAELSVIPQDELLSISDDLQVLHPTEIKQPEVKEAKKTKKLALTGEMITVPMEQPGDEPFASLTKLEVSVLEWIVTNDFLDGDEPIDRHVWAPYAEDFAGVMTKKQLGGVMSSLTKKGCMVFQEGEPDGKAQTHTVAITKLGFDSLEVHKAQIDAEFESMANEQPDSDEQTERKGRGYANAGKKYNRTGERVETFKIGKVAVEKGTKLFFKINGAEVCGVFSHLNQCAACPEGYAIIRFEGKNFERRQSRVSLVATEG